VKDPGQTPGARTAGDITHARVLKIALPIVLSNATVPLLGAVDTAVVGQMGQAAPIGAVGIGAVALAILYWIFGFLRMGTSGLAAQAVGAGDRDEASAVLVRALMIGLAAGLVFILFQAILFAAIFRLAPASAAVEDMARHYLAIRIWGAPATIANYAITGWLIAHERTRAILVLQVWMNGLNILLDLWFVLGLGWGVGGVAFASLIAEASGLALGLYLCRGGLAVHILKNRALILDRLQLRRMATVNSDIMIRSVLLQGAFTTFVFLGARFGDITLAANQVLMQFLEITAYALDGFAFAAEALVGQAVGARARADLRRAALLPSLWGLGGALALGLFFWLAGPLLIDLMATSAEVRAAARVWLVWAALSPVIGIACWMLDGIFIGATRTRDMRLATVETMVLYIPAIFALAAAFGNHGLWAGLQLMFILRALTLGRRLMRIATELAT
jgi:MATE family multidrug resistance protein